MLAGRAGQWPGTKCVWETYFTICICIFVLISLYLDLYLDFDTSVFVFVLLCLQPGPKHVWAQPQSHISPLLASCDLQSWRLLHLLSKQSVLYSLSSKACCTHFQTGCTLQQFASPSYFCSAPYFRSDSEKFSQSLSSFCCPRLSKRIYVLIFRLVTFKGHSGNFAYRANETRNVNYRANETQMRLKWEIEQWWK